MSARAASKAATDGRQFGHLFFGGVPTEIIPPENVDAPPPTGAELEMQAVQNPSPADASAAPAPLAHMPSTPVLPFDEKAHDATHAPNPMVAAGAAAPTPKSPKPEPSLPITEAEKDAVHRVLDPKKPDYMNEMGTWNDAQISYYVDCINPQRLKVLIDKGKEMKGANEKPVTISFRNLFYKKNGQMRLQGVSGYLKPGQMVCVLGGTDSGITSLLMVLSGRQQGGFVTGELLVNGAPPDNLMRRQIGFIPKDDIAFPTLTVKETLEFSSRLRLSHLIPDKVKRIRAMTTLKLLGLRHTADTIVGSNTLRGVSGGEKRRVSIGVELVAGHSSIIADLPTNGLDSASAYDVINTYRNLAQYGGRSLMCSLVQPSPELLGLFNQVLIMSKGVCLYFGPVDRVQNYFFGLGYQMPSTKALPDYLEELSVAPERFFLGDAKPAAATAGAVRDEKGNTAVPHMHTVASMSVLDGPTPTDATSSQQPPSSPHRPIKTIQLDAKGIPFIGLDDIAQLESIPTVTVGGAAAVPAAAPVAAPPPVVYREPALDDEWGGRDPNAPKPTRVMNVKGHKVVISHVEAMNHLFRAYKQSDEYRELGAELWSMAPTFVDPNAKSTERKFNSSFLLQVELCLTRQAQIIWRNKGATIGGFIRQIMIALLVGSLFWQIGTAQKDARTRFGLFFFMLSFNTMGSIQSIPALMEQRLVYYSQTHAGYYRGPAFYISYILTEIPLSAINTFLFTIVLYPMSGLTNGIQSEEFGYLFTMIFVINLVSKTWCLFMACACPNQSIAQAITPITMLLFSMFSGYMVPRKSIPDGWIWVYFMSFFTYAIKGLTQNELLPLVFTCQPDDIKQGVCPITSGYIALKQYNMEPELLADGVTPDPDEKWLYLRNAVLFFIAFNVGACYALLKINHWNSDSSAVGSIETEEDDEILDELFLGETPVDAAAPAPAGAVAVDVVPAHKPMVVTPTSLSFHNLTYSVDVPNPGACGGTTSRPLLKHVFGFVKPGMMVALMGPSGAGKTTLLDVLANKKTGGRVTGSMLINNKPRDGSFQLISGYVEQFDSHDETSTVKEAITFSAQLRLPSDMDDAEKAQRVESVLDTLGLRSVANQQIGSVERGGISPELRKKVTIAVELVMNPAILFLDEPTTGLDSLGALAVMDSVRKLAAQISVVCTIHQPSAEIMEKFDYMLLMKKGGEVSYFGPLPQLSDYLGAVGLGRCPPGRNIADHVLEVAGGGVKMTAGNKPVADPAQLYLASPQYAATRETIKALGHDIDNKRDDPILLGDAPNLFALCTGDTTSGFHSQFSSLLVRFVLSKLRDTQSLRARIGSACVISLILGTLYYQLGIGQLDAQNRVSLMYLSALFPCFSAASAIPLVIGARPVYFRERQAKMYSPLAYYIARSMAEVPFILFEGMIYGTVVYWTAGLKSDGNGIHYALFLACYMVMRSMGFAFAELCASLVEKAEGATALNSILLTLMMLFTGFLVPKASIPQGWIWMYYASVFRYPVAFLCRNELSDLVLGCPNNQGGVGPYTALFNASNPADPMIAACTQPERQLSNTACYSQFCPVTNGNQMLQQFGMQDDNMGYFFAIMVGMNVGYRLFGFLALRNIQHIKRSVMKQTLRWESFKAELWVQIQLASPVVLANVLWYGVMVVNMVFIGHVEASPHLISAAALSNMFTNVTGFSLGFGLSSGIDTLGGQAFGGKNYKMVSRVLQRTLCIITAFCIPALVIWYFSESILVLMGQDPEIAHLASRYARLCMPGLWPSLAYQAVVTYLQCQGIMGAEVYVGAAMNLFNFVITWFFVVHLGLGFEGGAIANSTSNWVGLGILISAIWYNEYHVLTWEPWSRKCLTKWWQVLSISVPGMFMSCAEWWIFEIFVVIAGLMGPLALASYGIVQQLSVLLFMIPLGISVASTTRVSNLLGANQASQAQFSAWVSLVYAQMLIVVNLTLLFALHNHVGRIFSSDPLVIKAVGDLLTILALTLFFDGTQTVFCGILKGMGRQKIGSVINFIGYYLIALPSALVYVYYLGWGVAGLWWGLLSGLAFVTVVFFFLMLQVDWSEEASHALRRMAEEASPATGPAKVAADADGMIDSDETTELLYPRPRHSPPIEPGVGNYLMEHSVPLHARNPYGNGTANGIGAGADGVAGTHPVLFQRSLSDGTVVSTEYSINAARPDGGHATETVVLHAHGTPLPSLQRSISDPAAAAADDAQHSGTLLNALQMINDAARSGYGSFHHSPKKATATASGSAAAASNTAAAAAPAVDPNAADLAAAGIENDHDADEPDPHTVEFAADPLRK